MDVFLSYPSTDKRLADKLREELATQGLSVWSDTDGGGSDWRGRIEDAVRSARHILILIGSSKRVDEAQQFTWRAALEAVWQDPKKRLVPILLPGAEIPAFVHSGTSGELQAVRVEDPRDVRSVAAAIVEVLKVRKARTRGLRSEEKTDEARPKSAFSISVPKPDDERSARLSTIAEYAERMRSR